MKGANQTIQNKDLPQPKNIKNHFDRYDYDPTLGFCFLHQDSNFPESPCKMWHQTSLAPQISKVNQCSNHQPSCHAVFQWTTSLANWFPVYIYIDLNCLKTWNSGLPHQLFIHRVPICIYIYRYSVCIYKYMVYMCVYMYIYIIIYIYVYIYICMYVYYVVYIVIYLRLGGRVTSF